MISANSPTSAPSAPSESPTLSPEVARRRLIEERQKRSVVWRVIHLLGSLKLALFLLSTIAIACAVATFYEAEFNAKVAQHYIYKAPWFLFWLGLLCLNLLAVTLTRWPWQKKHTGFIITHYSIITLLIGGVIGSRFGFEGNVILNKDQPSQDRITTSRSIIQLEDPNSPALFIKPFDASVIRLSPERPRRLPVPGTPWTIEAIGFSADLVRETVLVPISAEQADRPAAEFAQVADSAQSAQSAQSAGPGAVVRFRSEVAGRADRMVLTTTPAGGEATDPSRSSLFGMAEVILLPEMPTFVTTPHTETQMVFSRFEPVREGTPSGLRFALAPDASTLRIIPPDASATTYLLSDLIGQEVQAGAARVSFREFWPDFEMIDGRPVNKSDAPNNPAVLVQIDHETSTVSADSPLPLPASGPVLLLAPSQKSASPSSPTDPETPPTVAYRLLRDGRVLEAGEAAIGEEKATGWNDWTFVVMDWQDRAVAVEQVRPAQPGLLDELTGIPGFLAVLDTGDGQRGEPTWVESGRVTTLAAGHRFLRMGYGLQLERVPFSIRLLDFNVPRFEGTQTPANFIASVEFRDSVTGETRQDIAQMNRPANWPGGFWALTTGLNYKFSQAEWNPQDLDETTLQVLYDPGWLLKWIGSLGMCLGIGIMFYWKPR